MPLGGANARRGATRGAKRGRYAPSPTGELHLGNARTALVAWLAARAMGGSFVMRIEDLDPPRVVVGAEARILDDLRWLGLEWDEGPDVGGPHAPYRQSERSERYREALARLAAAGRLYACDCTRSQLRGALSAPHGGEGPPYPGFCREKKLPIDLEVDVPPGGRAPALRFRVEEAVEVVFEDAVAGTVRQQVAREVGDFIVRRSDGLFPYQLAVTVDDGLMEIEEVVRGADLLDSTARQILLQEALGYPRPAYAHVPLVLAATGERLAKRDRPATIRAIRDARVPPEALVGELARSLGLAPNAAPVRADDLVANFAWERLSRQSWRAPEHLAASHETDDLG
jgi:glutamyl-tRNA synthetase